MRLGAQRPDLDPPKARYIDFNELMGFYEKVDRDKAAEWGKQWSDNATKVMEPKPEPIRKAGGVYLAILELLNKYGTDNITMNCLGGFARGSLPAYPCLGFIQLLNDGKQGVCEAMPDDTLSMMMARILTGRPGFVSDPALDTSKNQIVYAHCAGHTTPSGPQGQSNGYRIRTLHNRDPCGCCSESLPNVLCEWYDAAQWAQCGVNRTAHVQVGRQRRRLCHLVHTHSQHMRLKGQ